MDGFKKFMSDFGGALIGAIISILILCTGLYKVIIGIILIVIGMFLGNYIQKNKAEVKEKLKYYIDKM